MIALGSLATSGLALGQSASDHSVRLDQYLSKGEVAEAAKHFLELAESNPSDGGARLAAGVSQFLLAIEHLGQASHRFGLMNNNLAGQLPLARLPVPENKAPKVLSYAALRDVIQRFSAELRIAAQSLAKVQTEQVHLDLYLGRIRLDLNEDGQRDDQESLWQISRVVNNRVTEEAGKGFVIGVDGADVHWLRGYAHFLMAFCDVVLAYDEQQLFECCGHLLFANVESPHRTALVEQDQEMYSLASISDAIAAIHLTNFPLLDRDHMKSAHDHLLKMIEQSRLCWKRALAETDDNNEWLPNPNQTGVLNVQVPREIVTGWSEVLDEIEALLKGEKLVPYWRKYGGSWIEIRREQRIPNEGMGVNLNKFFLEPKDFDLVLAIQGTGIEPYLMEGKLSTPESWDRLTRVFRGQFFGFAFWFN
jgi:hypothetical protein